MAERTIKALLAASVREGGDRTALCFRRDGGWQTVTYRQLLMRSRQVAQLLSARGVKAGHRVGLLLDNGPEWPEIYFGITGMACAAVPLDPGLQEQDVAHILRHAEAQALITDARHYPLVSEIEHRMPALRHIVLVDGAGVLRAGAGAHGRVIDYETGLAAAVDGALSDRGAYDAEEPSEDDIASILYTSGTTGRPKGAMLSHLNFAANVESCLNAVPVQAEDHFLLTLPLHHAFAFTVNLLAPLARGARISLVENLRSLLDSLAETRPTVLIGVPSLLQKMQDSLEAGLERRPVARSLNRLGLGRIAGSGSAALGGKLRLVISGGGSCGGTLLRQWSRLGLPVHEGYGLTETAPVVSLNPPGRAKPGSAGKPISGVEIRILDPDEGGEGEVAVRGENVMSGYYRNPEATAAILRDGWLLTGDLGRLDRDGYLFISGRKQDLIVDPEGRTIHPEEVEILLRGNPFVLEALALGYRAPNDRTGMRVGAIVVPDQQTIDDYGARQERLLSDSEAEALVREESAKALRGLDAYKRPDVLQIRYERFEKTPTLKIKRYLYAIDTSRLA